MMESFWFKFLGIKKGFQVSFSIATSAEGLLHLTRLIAYILIFNLLQMTNHVNKSAARVHSINPSLEKDNKPCSRFSFYLTNGLSQHLNIEFRRADGVTHFRHESSRFLYSSFIDFHVIIFKSVPSHVFTKSLVEETHYRETEVTLHLFRIPMHSGQRKRKERGIISSLIICLFIWHWEKFTRLGDFIYSNPLLDLNENEIMRSIRLSSKHIWNFISFTRSKSACLVVVRIIDTKIRLPWNYNSFQSDHDLNIFRMNAAHLVAARALCDQVALQEGK